MTLDPLIKSDRHTRRLWITTADLHRVTGCYVDNDQSDRIHYARFALMWRRLGVQVFRQGMYK